MTAERIACSKWNARRANGGSWSSVQWLIVHPLVGWLAQPPQRSRAQRSCRGLKGGLPNLQNINHWLARLSAGKYCHGVFRTLCLLLHTLSAKLLIRKMPVLRIRIRMNNSDPKDINIGEGIYLCVVFKVLEMLLILHFESFLRKKFFLNFFRSR